MCIFSCGSSCSHAKHVIIPNWKRDLEHGKEQQKALEEFGFQPKLATKNSPHYQKVQYVIIHLYCNLDDARVFKTKN